MTPLREAVARALDDWHRRPRHEVIESQRRERLAWVAERLRCRPEDVEELIAVELAGRRP